MQPLRLRFNQWLFAFLSVLWCAAIAGGFGILWDYGSAPGPSPESPADWPGDSQINRDPHRPTLVMFAHAKCPCTRASIAELARAMAVCGERLTAHVVFVKPAGACCDWGGTDNWDAAAGIPGVQARTDAAGQEARRFAAKTSGLVLLYDGQGKLVFHGGITAARGHSGDSLGHTAILDYVNAGTLQVSRTPVFGCLLQGRCEIPNHE